MPPKIVYGKKKNATRATTSFSEFISPGKGGVTTHVDMGKGAVNAMKNKISGGGEEGRDGGEGMQALEKGLECLRLGMEQTQTADVVKTKKPRQRKDAGHDKDEMKRKQKSEQDISGKEVEGMDEERRSKKAPGRTPKTERRKSLERRNDSTTVGAGDHILEPRSTKGKKRHPTSETHSSPTRVRQPASRAKPAPSGPQSLPTPEPTPEPDDLYSNYASPLLALTDTKMYQPFGRWSAELETHFKLTKIAEASFSEVYRLSALNSSGSSSQESVLKLVALRTPSDVILACQSSSRTVRDREAHVAKAAAEREEKDKWKSEVDDVVSEVKLLHNLNHIPGFTDFRDLTILQGRPTPFFSKAWKDWNKSRARGHKSEFPDPSKKASYEDTQLWAVIEMQDAGTDCEKLMENGGLSSIWEAWDVFWGVCLSVAKAEETCKFEHRDLHMGNICVRSSRAGGDVMSLKVEDPTHRKFRFSGLETTVIDYTLSRADILASPDRRTSSSSAGTVTSSASGGEVADVAFLDLDKDPALFEGDASEEYQYEIYRLMRGAALYGKPMQCHAPDVVALEPRRSPRKNTHIRFDSDSSIPLPSPTSNVNVWAQFHPKTNLVWAHFLLHKLLAHIAAPDSLSIKDIMKGIPEGADPVKVKKKALRLHSVLDKVKDLLCPIALGGEESLGSVKDLVLLGLERGWLRVGDVSG